MTKVESTEASTLIQLFFQSRTKKSEWRISRGLGAFLTRKENGNGLKSLPSRFYESFCFLRPQLLLHAQTVKCSNLSSIGRSCNRAFRRSTSKSGSHYPAKPNKRAGHSHRPSERRH